MKKLNFGCGADIRKGWDNYDINECDADKFPYPFKKNTYNRILLRQCLNMFLYPDKCLLELWRISKPNAEIEILVPHYNNKGSHNDIQTKSYFNERSFELFVKDKFEIKEMELTPTIVGKYIPFKKYLSLFFNGLYSNIHVKLEVIK